MSRRRTRIVAAIVAVVAVGAVAGVWMIRTAAADRSAEHSTASQRPTVTVARGDLSTTTSLGGTLGFGTPVALTARGEGVITLLPAPGATLERGQAVFGVDGVPVPLFYGTIPLYRDLTADGVTRGPDVKMVAQNLAALGFTVGSIPDSPDMPFTSALRAGVRAWQKSLGLEQSGAVGAGSVVVLPDTIRIAGVTAQLGDPAGEEILSWTSPAKQLWAQVPVDQVGAFAVGAAISVTLADGQTVAATVASVAAVSHPPDDTTPGAPDLPVIDVLLTPAAEALEAVAAAPAGSVRVAVTLETHPDVLHVPVSALLAVSGGGYALELPDGTLVAITTGMFADGEVEVSGAGLTDGLDVVVAR